jgi:hypothetical protein
VAAVLNEMRGSSGEDALAAAAAERIEPLIKGILNVHEKYR